MKFKVGDKVRVLELNSAPLEVGTITEVRTTPNNINENYTVYTPDKKDYWYYKEHMLELVENMNQEIEVGDKVKYNDGDVFSGKGYRVVKSISGNDIYYQEGGFDKLKDLKVFEKANKQEIVGYELLKDLPGIQGNKVFQAFSDTLNIQGPFGEYKFTKELLEDNTWFKPIYKAKEIVVKISKGREVTIKDNKVILKHNQLSFHDITVLNNLLNPPVVVASEFKVSVSGLNVGCQSFDAEDIKKVYQAIQNLK